MQESVCEYVLKNCSKTFDQRLNLRFWLKVYSLKIDNLD